MIVVVTPTAHEQIDDQIAYGIERFGRSVAERTAQRIERSLSLLADFPRSGPQRHGTNLRETAIPHTPFVVIYRIEDAAGIVRVLGFCHGSQDRSTFEPE
jgi:plasmid stabilization system protein ParE